MIVSAIEAVDFESVLLSVAGNDPFACRIISLYNSYNAELAFVDYWLVNADETGECKGAVARNGTNFIVYLSDDSVNEEVSAFIRVAGASSVLCDDKFELDLYGGTSVSGFVLERSEPVEDDDNVDFGVPDIKAVYDLLVKCTDDNFTPPAFDEFYVDVNHKIRHNAIRIASINSNDGLAAVAMTVAESSNAAVLGAVACDPEYRKHGYGSAVVRHLTNALIDEGKTVYLHRAENANANFYANLGFKEIGRWKEYYFGG